MRTDWNTFYTGSQENVVAAIAQIDANCSFPDQYTETWGIATQAYEQDFWFVIMPPPEGYKEPTRSFSQDEMIQNVTNVIEQQSQPNWWPPFPPEDK